MALALLAVDDDGHRAGNTKNCKVPFLKVLYEVWKNMAVDGVITEVCLRGLIQKATTTKIVGWIFSFHYQFKLLTNSELSVD